MEFGRWGDGEEVEGDGEGKTMSEYSVWKKII